MAPRLRLSDHSDGVSCERSDCSPPPSPAPVPPSPLPPPSSSPGSHGRATFVTALIIAGSALAIVVLCLFLFLFVRRRRRRREALLEAALAPAAPDGVGVLDLADQEAEGEEIVHHPWHIRTVGLDEAAIESIALTRYRAGAAGASDCAVCLGEFVDGELLRLLSRCAHAFHVRCIDTWLRAHVNCPLCRSHVLDSGPAAQQSDSPEGTDAVDAGQAASSNTTTEHEQPDQQRTEHEQPDQQREVRLQIDQHDGRSPEQPHRHPGPRGQNFRRVASVDLSSLISSAAPEPDEQAGGEKQGTGRAVHCKSLSPGCSVSPKNHRGLKRSLSVGSR